METRFDVLMFLYLRNTRYSMQSIMTETVDYAIARNVRYSDNQFIEIDTDP